jgi:hypothetical protein
VLLAFILCVVEEFYRIRTNGAANRNKLCYVEPSLPKLKLGHKGLTLPKPLPEFRLGNARILASLHQQLNHSLIVVGSD